MYFTSCVFYEESSQQEKCSDVIEYYGLIDELEAYILFAINSICKSGINDKVKHIDTLKEIIDDIRSFYSMNNIGNYILENINKYSNRIAGTCMHGFIDIPYENEQAIRLNIVRTLIRRVERIVVKMLKNCTHEKLHIVYIYLNALSKIIFRMTLLYT